MNNLLIYILLLTLHYVPGSCFLCEDVVVCFVAGDAELNSQSVDVASTTAVAMLLSCKKRVW